MSEIAALNSLLRGATIDDHAEALRLADGAIASAKPGSAEALTAHHTKVVALLKLDRFADALRAAAAAGDKLEDRCVLERAYALYKTDELAAAEQLLATAGKGTERGLQHVAAQVAYRAEHFDRAAELYAELAKEEGTGARGEENDLRINALAVDAQLEWQGRGHVIPAARRGVVGRDALEAFETAYNAACGCIARGDFGKAAVLLKRARDLCEASEELGDEEKQAELAPIVVQQAYVAARLGKPEEAAAFQKGMKLSEISDLATRTVAQSNSQILAAESNPFMAQRLSELKPALQGSDRLFEYQSATLQRTKYIIELQAQKFKGVAKTTSHILAASQGSSIAADKASLGVLHASAASQLQTGKDALRRILPLLDSRPDDVGLLLTIIQLYVQTQNPGPALTLLEAFFRRLEAATTPDDADVRFAPGLVAIAVALYRQQGRTAAVRAELRRAAAHWQSKHDPDGSGASLLREAGIELLRSNDPADLAAAGAAFQRLTADSETPDPVAVAGLIASFATTDPARVERHLSALPPVERVVAGVDVQALLDGGVASLPAASTTTTTTTHPSTSRKRGAGADHDGAARKRHKRRLPKDYDPARTPDPERWLPLRDRSSYRPKGRKGKKRAAEATQGGGVAVAGPETLALAGGAGAVPVQKAAGGGGGGGGGSAGGGGGGGGKKNKKKGKK